MNSGDCELSFRIWLTVVLKNWIYSSDFVNTYSYFCRNVDSFVLVHLFAPAVCKTRWSKLILVHFLQLMVCWVHQYVIKYSVQLCLRFQDLWNRNELVLSTSVWFLTPFKNVKMEYERNISKSEWVSDPERTIRIGPQVHECYRIR